MATEDLLPGDWKQVRARAKERWHALTDDDLKLVDGSRTMLASVLREKYGYNEEQAQTQVQQFVDQLAAPAQP